MRVLVDECVDQRLRLLFTRHDCQTAAYAKLSGLKNGALLTAAEAAGFDVLITTDQEIPFQQNLAMRRISILILCAPTNRLRRPDAPRAGRSAGTGRSRSWTGHSNRRRQLGGDLR